MFFYLFFWRADQHREHAGLQTQACGALVYVCAVRMCVRARLSLSVSVSVCLSVCLCLSVCRPRMNRPSPHTNHPPHTTQTPAFRQAQPYPTAADAMRALSLLQNSPPPPSPARPPALPPSTAPSTSDPQYNPAGEPLSGCKSRQVSASAGVVAGRCRRGGRRSHRACYAPGLVVSAWRWRRRRRGRWRGEHFRGVRGSCCCTTRACQT